uniref:GAE domain-containing protein n=2 Tax=Homalodisca liturata TaxID=320908 RepID=A0A1B6I1C3_9HEMI
MELQQRGVEFTQLFGKYNHLRRPLLERMPAMEVSRTHTSETNGEMEGEVLPDTTQPPDTQAQDSNALLVLLGGDTGEGDIVRPVETSKSTDNQDLLDLLGGLDIGTTIPSTNSNTNGLPNNNNNNILLDSTLLDTTPSTVSELVAYEKNGLRLLFTLERLGETPSTTVIQVAANNYAQSPFTEFLFQAAVPKTFQLQMQPPSGTVISPGGQITQTIKVINPNRTMLKMRIRISYTCDGTPVQDQADVNNFPPESWQ